MRQPLTFFLRVYFARIRALTLVGLSLAVFFWPGHAAADGRKKIFISDMDDTIKYFNARSPLATVFNTFHPNQPFLAMPDLYSALAENGGEFHFVTNAKSWLKVFAGRVLNKYPRGEKHFNPGGFQDGDFKEREIEKIMRENPDAEIYLIGDNGQKDPQMFLRLLENPAVNEQIKGVFVHRLYDRPIHDERMVPFLTSAGLALRMRERGLIHPGQSERVLSRVERGLARGNYRARKLALPWFAGLETADIDSLFPYLKDITPTEAELVTSLRKSVIERQLRPPSRALALLMSCLSHFESVGE